MDFLYHNVVANSYHKWQLQFSYTPSVLGLLLNPIINYLQTGVLSHKQAQIQNLLKMDLLREILNREKASYNVLKWEIFEFFKKAHFVPKILLT